MSLGNLGQNSAEEFFETIIYHTAYSEAKEQIKGLTQDIDNDVLKDALDGALNVLAMGLIFQLIRSQETFIQGVFDVAKGLILIILGSSYAQKMKNKLSNMRGFGLFKKLEIFKSSYSDRVQTARLVMEGANSHFSAERTAQSEHSTINTTLQMKEHIVNKERLSMEVGSTMAQRYNETLMFKLFTKSFTANDETLIKKILGRDTGGIVNIEDMNKIADFMFVTDSEGKITGLTEQLFSLVNGLGYLHNKN